MNFWTGLAAGAVGIAGLQFGAVLVIIRRIKRDPGAIGRVVMHHVMRPAIKRNAGNGHHAGR